MNANTLLYVKMQILSTQKFCSTAPNFDSSQFLEEAIAGQYVRQNQPIVDHYSPVFRPADSPVFRPADSPVFPFSILDAEIYGQKCYWVSQQLPAVC